MATIDETAFDNKRERMVSRQIRARGIKSEKVLRAMGKVPRHRFVPEAALSRAYEDYPLSIGHGQTISQPYIVAKMTELLSVTPDDVVLEVGAGCGYQTAILAELARKVYAVERIQDLGNRASANLHELGYDNVELEVFDGSGGWPEKAPFNRILVAAGAPEVPEPLKKQLSDGGRLVLPVGLRHHQELQVIIREPSRYRVVRDILCRFVDLVGRHGWDGNQSN